MNSLKMELLILVVLPILLLGCATRAANRYSPKTENVVQLREWNDTKVTVANFDSTAETPSAAGDNSSLMCRAAGPIKTPNGQPFHEYLKNAFIDELQLAKLYEADASISITGTVERIDFSSTTGEWYLGWNLNSSNGKSLSVTNTTSFTTSWAAAVACDEAAKAFAPAVQDLITRTINHPKFESLLEPK